MVRQDPINRGQEFYADTVAQVETFAEEHRDLLRTAGLVTAAVVVGGAGGLLVAKSAVMAKGIWPLAIGAVGGGATLFGATRRRMRTLQDTLTEQTAQTTAARAERNQLKAALAAAQAQIQELQAKLAERPTAPVAPEELQQIKGIGRVYAQRLNAAGIYTLADLAEQTAEQLRPIIGPKRIGNMVQPGDWIEQARQLLGTGGKAVPAVPASHTKRHAQSFAAAIALDRLEAIQGITAPQAARLNRGGILTYADLAEQTTARVQALLGTERPPTTAIIDEWVDTARKLAIG